MITVLNFDVDYANVSTTQCQNDPFFTSINSIIWELLVVTRARLLGADADTDIRE